MRLAVALTRGLPLFALLAALAAFVWPGVFVPGRDLIVPLLMLIMFGMGATLTPRDFGRAFARPGAIGLGVALQYLAMPLVAWLIAALVALPDQVAVGLILVGAVSGGTASNVICHLARGDVALSISMTAVSTLVAVVATPLLTWLYAGRGVPVPVLDMMLSITRVVILPVCAGMALNVLAGARLAGLKPWLPVVSTVGIVLVIGIIVALNRESLASLGPAVVLAVVLHNGVGLALGYGAAMAIWEDPVRARTVAIEVGMQNSGLAVALATQYFSAAAAMPGALFSVWHNLSGSVLAAWWARRA
ncbi:MAG: bile acid:sodium symporter family protein [Salinisphaeraceae bacterium]